jgi:hypothetical protein
MYYYIGFWPGPQKINLICRKILNQETLNQDSTVHTHVKARGNFVILNIKYLIFKISHSLLSPLATVEFIKDIRDTDFCAKTMSFACNSSKVQEVWIMVILYGMEVPNIPNVEE